MTKYGPYDPWEKEIARAAMTIHEACVQLRREAKRQDMAVTADLPLRVLYQRILRAEQQIEAAMPYIGAILSAPNCETRPNRPIEDHMFPDAYPETKRTI